MKIQITGSTNSKLMFVKFVKIITEFGLKESKELVDAMPYHNNTMILETTQNFDYVKKEFDNMLSDSGLVLRRYRIEIIDKLLRTNDPDWDVKKDEEYSKYLELFNHLFKHDKHNLKNLLNQGVDNLKNHLDDYKI